MDDAGGPQGENLAETTQRQNSNLRRLIDAVGTLLAGSRELLKRLQPLDGAKPKPPSDTARRHTEADTLGVPPSDKPPPAGPEKS